MGSQVSFNFRTSYISTIVSMALVLFMLGLTGLLLLTSRKLGIVIRENITLSLYLKNDIKEVDILQLKKKLANEKYVRESVYISKDDAVRILQEQLDANEDFIKFLDGYNPLPSSIDIRLKAAYANPDSIAKIETIFTKNPNITEVSYQKSLVHLINENINKISMVMLLFCFFLFIISAALINNTIRLSIYSKRFLIRTMQLVGATAGFVRKPFLIQGVICGIYGSFTAIMLLITVIYWLHRAIPELFEIHDAELAITLFLAMLLTGALSGLIFTFFAVRNYIHLGVEELY